VPLIAGGAALTGLAGAVVLGARSGRRRKVLGVSLPKRNGLKVDAEKISAAVTDAAKRADQFGQRVSRVAGSVRQVSETANEAAKKS
jgi:methyl-accepting chemotaxis protein